MKFTNIIPAAAAIACLAGAAIAAERVVEIPTEKGTVVGTLETPEGAAAPVVLLLHGFTGTRDELPVAGTDEGVFARTARLLAEAGYASLRIDFRGSGDSDGDWADTTFGGQIADALAAIDWLGQAEDVDAERLAVLGWSQGGLIASHAADASDAVDALILWAPLANPLSTFASLFGAEAMDKALALPASETITLALPWGVDTTLKGAYFDELPTTSTAAALAGYDGPLLTFVGSQDTVVFPQPESGEVLVRYHAGEGELVVLDMDHVFNAFSGPETLDTEMMPRVTDWLDSNL